MSSVGAVLLTLLFLYLLLKSILAIFCFVAMNIPVVIEHADFRAKNNPNSTVHPNTFSDPVMFNKFYTKFMIQAILYPVFTYFAYSFLP